MALETFVYTIDVRLLYLPIKLFVQKAICCADLISCWQLFVAPWSPQVAMATISKRGEAKLR
jgi:hypothetical protein